MAARALTMRHSVHTERALCTAPRHSPRVHRGARATAARVHAMALNNANPPPLVKVCGVTTGEDAAHAAGAGANFIGMILWPKSKRSIDVGAAREVVAAAKEHGAAPVGVFVSENAQEIEEQCAELGIEYAQLHGDGARNAFMSLPQKLKVVWVLNADANGKLITPMPGQDDERMNRVTGTGAKGWKEASDWMSRGRRSVEYLLVDGQTAGSGETFDWTQLKVPRGASRKGFMLAGGLDPSNVADAVRIVRPAVVDVASGVADATGVKKDPAAVEAFIAAVNSAYL